MSKRITSQAGLMAVLFFGILMGALDIAIVAPALHPIQNEFSITPRQTSWIFAVYMLFSLIGTPLMAKLADIHGRRLVYIADIVLFALGSIAVIAGGLTGQFWLFLTGRAIQGLGAGGIFPVASAVIGDTVVPEKRGSALGMLGAVWGLAFILGPILGGVLLPFGWTTLFWINLPIALILIVAAVFVLPAHVKGNTPPLDIPALLLLGATLASFAIGINQIDTGHFASSLLTVEVWLPIALSLALLGVLIASERQKVDNPLFPHALFTNPQLTLVYLIGGVYGLIQATLSFLPTLAMAAFSGQGMTSSQSSYMMLPMVLAMSIGSPVVGRILDRVGSRLVIVVGVVLSALGFLSLGLMSTSMAGYLVGEVLLGFGVAALAGAPLRYVVLAETPAKDRTIAQGLSSLFISVGGVLGTALIGGLAASGSTPLEGWSSAFLLVVFPSAVAIVLSLFLKNKHSERETAQRNHA